jgi:Tfp pilus assembly protein PilF
MLYLEKESDARAARVLEPVLTAHPEDSRAHLHMAMALAKSEPLRARGHAEKALRDSDPDRRQQAEVLLRALSVLTPA